MMYRAGTGVTRDKIKAHDLFQKACDAQSAQGCFYLGSSWLSQYEEVNKDKKYVENARRAFMKALDLNPAHAEAKEGFQITSKALGF
jgi:TPR repeat protein